MRSPTFGVAGSTRSRGRRQPYVRTRRYQVDGDANTAEPMVIASLGRDVVVMRMIIGGSLTPLNALKDDAGRPSE